ncbi:MAG: GntR family transcriptional regulator [Hyphomonadaceae bacterium]|nr:GntR family transcriptional regulator [Hyphomonadaceae bacterium]
MTNFSTRPLYIQVRDALAERIALGEWKPNTTVPNEMDLARGFGVSPGTTRKALDLLESEGIVTRRQGRGTFVNDPAAPELASRYSHFHSAAGERVIGEIKTLEVTEAKASEDERERLRLARDEKVYRLARIRSHRGKAFLMEDVVLPVALFPELPERNLASSGLTVVASAYGLALGKAVESVSPGTASLAAAKALHVEEGAAVLVLDRVILTRDGRPAEWRVAVCKTNDMRYKVQSA